MPNPNFTFIHSCLHYSGENYAKLTDQQQVAARRLADGFGAGVTDPDLLWDWSHVRDSSDEAIRLMAGYLARVLIKLNADAGVYQ